MATPVWLIARDDRQDVADFRRIQPGQNLVEQQQARFGRQRAREFQTLAPRDRQPGGGRVQPVGEADQQRDFLRATQRLLSRGMAQMGADRDILAHAQPREGPHDLEGAARCRARARKCGASARDVLTVETGCVPLVGVSKPEISPNNVVLPAPLGPIRPTMRPASTSSEAASTARGRRTAC